MFTRICNVAQRTFLTNLMHFRRSGSVLSRRLRERYVNFQSSRQKEPSIVNLQRILLGGCLISFAQDKITDEELVGSLKGFSESVNGSSTDSNYLNGLNGSTNSFSATTEPSILSDSEEAEESHFSDDPFINPPVTVFVRKLRMEFLQSFREFCQPSAGAVTLHPNSVDSLNDVTDNLQSVQPTLDSQLTYVVSNFDFQPDGTGFVDDSWELIIDRKELRVWRRAISFASDSGQILSTHSPTTASTVKYEYKLCGTMDDVSPLSFLEVQLNLAYRRHWDDRIVHLDYIDTERNGSDMDESECDVVRWVARFPLPLANREYIYIRRWWLQHYNSHSIESPPPIGSHAIVLSRSTIPHSDALLQTRSKDHKAASWTDRFRRSPVSVHAYRSEMLIKAKRHFEDLGLTYYLTYFDDPCLPVGDSTLSIVSGKAMNQFMDQLHSAALVLDRSGLPDGVNAIVFHNRSMKSPTSTTSTSRNRSSREQSGSSGSEQTISSSKMRFFTDHVHDSSQFSTHVY